MVRPLAFAELVRRSGRSEFLERYPWFFLVGEPALEQPEPAQRTDVFDTFEEGEPDLTQPLGRRGEIEAARLLVLPVRKVQEQFPSMITVGRTSNNDIVVSDINVSRFHAFFRVHPDRVELADAGAANGTFVNGKALHPKGPTQIVVPGDEVAFAHLEFMFLDAGATWDRLHGK